MTVTNAEFLRRLWSEPGFDELGIEERAKLADLLDEVTTEVPDVGVARRESLAEFIAYLLSRGRAVLGESPELSADHAARVSSAVRITFATQCESCHQRQGDPVFTGGGRFEDYPTLERIRILCPRCLSVAAPDVALPAQLRRHEEFWDVPPERWEELERRLAELIHANGGRRFDPPTERAVIRRAIDPILAELSANDQRQPDHCEGGYLSGEHWGRVKVAARVLAGYRCENCDGSPDDTHHETYARVGAESLDDVRILCRTCHGERHPDWINPARA